MPTTVTSSSSVRKLNSKRRRGEGAVMPRFSPTTQPRPHLGGGFMRWYNSAMDETFIVILVGAAFVSSIFGVVIWPWLMRRRR
jgi:hypothetical protein